MGKHWVRQQVRNKDVVQESVDQSVRWVDANRNAAAAIAGGIAVGAILLIALISHIRGAQTQSWDRLSVAQGMAYAGHPDEALQQIQQLVGEKPASDAAAFGQLFAGDVAYTRGQYKEALEHYNAVLERGKPAGLQPIALSDTAITQEAAGQFQPAQLAAQHFLEQYPDHFLAPQVHAILARTLSALGQAEQAKTTYQKIALQYEGTSWAAWASGHIQPAK